MENIADIMEKARRLAVHQAGAESDTLRTSPITIEVPPRELFAALAAIESRVEASSPQVVLEWVHTTQEGREILPSIIIVEKEA